MSIRTNGRGRAWSQWDTLAWARDQRVGDVGRKATLMVLAEFADQTGYCWPSQALLADQTEQSVSTIKRQLRWLEAEGFIARERRHDGEGHRTSDGYLLQFDREPRGQTDLLAQGSTEAGLGVKSGGPRGHLVTYEQPEQPDLEQPPRASSPSAPPRAPSADERRAALDAFVAKYPEHDGPNVRKTQRAFLETVNQLAAERCPPRQAWPRLHRAAENYAAHVKAEQTEPRFVIRPWNFLTDGTWLEWENRTPAAKALSAWEWMEANPGKRPPANLFT